MHNIKIRDRFLSDIKDHQMEIIKDDGLYRNIRFKRPNSSCYYFDIITWPGYLTITGDMGNYIFSRIDDMFGFFPMDKNDWNSEADGLGINPYYWEQKLRATCTRGSLKVFSEEILREAVKQHFDNYVESQADDENEYAAKENTQLWEQLESDVLCASNVNEAHQSVHNFEHDDFEFIDFWEHDLTEYCQIYIWCCYAIVWGIGQYNDRR